MKQRLAIATQLAQDPRVLLMDEPFGALDALTRATHQEELLQIWNETKKTIVFVTHSLREALFLSDRILFLGRNGTVREEVHVPTVLEEREDERLHREVTSHRFGEAEKKLTGYIEGMTSGSTVTAE